jgi:hypothetical protein
MADEGLKLSTGAVIELLAQIVPLLKGIIAPELVDQINQTIMDLRKQREEKYAKFYEAIAKMDVAVLNALARELFT